MQRHQDDVTVLILLHICRSPPPKHSKQSNMAMKLSKMSQVVLTVALVAVVLGASAATAGSNPAASTKSDKKAPIPISKEMTAQLNSVAYK